MVLTAIRPNLLNDEANRRQPRSKHTKNAAGAPGVNRSDPRVNGLPRLSLLLSTAICSCTSNTENEQLFAGLQSSY